MGVLDVLHRRLAVEALFGLVKLEREVWKAAVGQEATGRRELARHHRLAGERVGLRHRLHRQHRMVYFFNRLFDAFRKGDALLMEPVMDLI